MSMMLFGAALCALIGYATLFDLLVYGVCLLGGWIFHVWPTTVAALVLSMITFLYLVGVSFQRMSYIEDDEDWDDEEEDDDDGSNID